MKKIAIQFGAGNIGRGFIGWLLSETGYEVVFADVNDQIVQALKERKEYQVILANDSKDTYTVKNVTALNSRTEEMKLIEEITQAEIITTAVGPNIIVHLADVLAKGLESRKDSHRPLTFIACENMIGGTQLLKQAIYEKLSPEAIIYADNFVAFPNAAVDRIVPNQHHEDMLTVTVEPFYEWVVENPRDGKTLPKIEGTTYVEELEPYIERKLFTVNTGHAVTAYFGRYYGIDSIEEAINDEHVMFAVRTALDETGALLEKKFGFSHKEHQQYIEKIIHRFKNPNISDYVSRVGRSPIRKISEHDRFVQPAKQFVEAFNETPRGLSEAIAVAMNFDIQEDEEAQRLQQAIQASGIDEVIELYTGIKSYSILFDKIKESYENIAN